jgi:nifR3 family TIM-barrel protein
MSFWKSLKKPILVLAPMADVTDPAYRRLISEYKNPDVMWTEFVSADGLYHTREMKKMLDAENPLVRDLLYTPGEHPIVAQLFGSNPETMRYAAKLAATLGFDGVDLNMGCPDRSIEKQGSGASMIKTPEKVTDIMQAVRDGVRDAGRPEMSVSIKTRIGYNKEEIDTWIPAVLRAKPDVLTVHLRTRKEMSSVPAHWELLPRVVALRDALSPDTLIFGNGDLNSLEDARAKVLESGADGAMLGRAIFGRPWLFTGCSEADISPHERLEALLKLAHYFDELRPRKSFHLLKKHFKVFVTGWPGAAELRSRLMEMSTLSELEARLREAIELLG